MHPRLHKLIACCLAALYLLVGLWGQSLHYVLADLKNPQRQDSSAVQGTTFGHCHGPDFHWHFHSHREPAAAGSGHAGGDGSGDGRTGMALKSHRLIHSPHACPLLTIVSTLKLGYGKCAGASFGLGDGAGSLHECDPGRAFQITLRPSARGPPCGAAYSRSVAAA